MFPSNRSAMLFPPNLTGPLHLGSACVLWLTAREAMRRGIDVIIPLDDRYEVDSRRDLDAEAASLKSLDEALRLLGLPNYHRFRRSEHADPYLAFAETLVELGVAKWEGDTGVAVLADAEYVFDAVLGHIREFCSPLVFPPGRPYSTLTTVYDFLRFNVPMHIRGSDLLSDVAMETRWFRRIAAALKLDRTPPLRAHIPVITDAAGEPLHKSAGVDERYNFTHWAHRQGSVEARRRGLELMVLGWPDDKVAPGPFTWDQVLRCETVQIDATGRRVGSTQYFERGIFCDSDMVGAPD